MEAKPQFPLILPRWTDEWVDEHRRGKSDIDWARENVKPTQMYFVGDVVEFVVGGFGLIDRVSRASGGWPFSYATEDIEGHPPHARRKSAWHYDGDIKRLVAPSGVRLLAGRGSDENP